MYTELQWILLVILLVLIIAFIYLMWLLLRDVTKSQVAKIGKIIGGVLCVILFVFLSFHFIIKDGEEYDPKTDEYYPIKNGVFKVFTKDSFTLSNTFITQSDVDKLIDRYNNASPLEQQAINQEPLMRKLKEKGIIRKRDN